MSRDNILIIFASLIILIAITFFAKNRQKNILLTKQQEIETIKSEAIALDRLKKKWNNTKTSNNMLRQLRNSKLIKDEKSSKKQILEYENLNINEVDKISNKILNSNLKIKLFELKRLNDYNSSLRLEVGI